MKHPARPSLPLAFAGVAFLAAFASASAPPDPSSAREPGSRGPLTLVAASFLGGQGDDEIVGVGIEADGDILLAGNGGDLKLGGIVASTLGRAVAAVPTPDSGAPAPTNGGTPPPPSGFIVRLSADGQHALGFSRLPPGCATLEKLLVTEAGDVYVLGDAKSPIEIAGVTGSGRFIAGLTRDATAARIAAFCAGAKDFGVDGNGEIVVLTKGHLTRLRLGGKEPVWDITFGSHGDNRSWRMALAPETGLAVITGYGMTNTGHQPYKDPYAYGFDRSGKQLWCLWNPDPKLEAAAQFGGNGLMADTTGRFAANGEGGTILLGLRADGGNTVLTRDPLDPGQKLDDSVFAGVFQATPGFGFKGASATSALFRADGLTGRLEKGTFMCAWPSSQHAGTLFLADAAGSRGMQFAVGGSSFGFKTKLPWYEAPEGGYLGGGFLAVFDRDFKALQAGYFSGTDMRCVAARGDTVVIGGKANEKNTGQTPTGTFDYPVPAWHPLQPNFGGGKHDGYFAVFKLSDRQNLSP